MADEGRGKKLFTIAGLPIRANVSWLILVVLVVYMLAMDFFPSQLEASQATYMLLSILGAAGLFASLIAHEVAHSLTARYFGMPVSGITLFAFGGASELMDEPPTAGSEFLMAAAGPLLSILLAVVSVFGWAVLRALGAPEALLIVVFYVAVVNMVLAAFNLLPAFPLDGGRILRSFIWGATDDLAAATRAASRAGYVFGWMLLFMGVWGLTEGAVIQGIWILIVGLFVQRAAVGHRRIVEVEQNLRGVRVDHFLAGSSVNVPRTLDVQRFVLDFVLQHRLGYYPVVDEYGRLVGVITARDPQRLQKLEWSATRVEHIMSPITQDMLLRPETDAAHVLHSIRRGGERRLIVVEDGRPLGVLSVRDLVTYATR